MKVTPDQLKDYVFGELNAAERREVEAALHVDPTLRDEYARLQVTQTALFSVREEEMPRRIAFVSDPVFEPKWWQRWLSAGPQLGFASAALVAAAIVFHAVHQQPVPAPAPVAQFDQAAFERRIAEGVARALPAALEQAEARHKTQLASVIQEAESKYQRIHREEARAMEAAYNYEQEKKKVDYLRRSEFQ
ncbi:MAG: hypothetical protein FJW38_10170 [Acidobacteria bacterium]|nr:hypothetical protein [Acidobacteriota bacterium]